MNRKTELRLLATTLLICGTAASALGQSADALLNKLVEKGVLSKSEADDLKKESNAGFEKAYRSRTGLPEWVDQLKFYGDFRGRFEMFRTENDDLGVGAPNKDRDRLRYRIRVGAAVTMKEAFELGFRLASGEPNGTFGGEPIANNSTMQNNGSKKSVFIDLAYGKWTPIKDETWLLSGTFGKMENPFTVSPMVFDHDYTPEGLALQSRYNVNENHTLKLNGAVFALDEIGQGSEASDDPFLYGIQARYDAKWTPEISSSLGLSWFVITEEGNLGNGAVPNVSVGNTRNGAGNLINEYYPIVVDGAVTYTFAKAPLYPGKFPVTFGTEYMHNPGADVRSDGMWGGLAFGKVGKKGTWEASVKYIYVENDAWYEEITESDFGAYYSTAPSGSGGPAGFLSGPGTKGWQVRTGYALADCFSLGATWYYTDLIHPGAGASGGESESTTHRVQLDAIWKF